MKSLTIFNKNMKTVSRNPTYFIILILCPVILILIAGAMLNSADFDNLKIGLIDQNPSKDLSISSSNTIGYASLDICLGDLINGETGVCMHLTNKTGFVVDIYLDNSRKLIELYSKQFILQQVLNEQSSRLTQTTTEINSQIEYFSKRVVSAKKELNDAYYELDSQEKMLIDYQRNLTQARQQFNNFYDSYNSLKESTDSLRSDLNSFRSGTANLNGQITQVNGEIAALKIFLSTRLSAADFSQASTNLDSISNNLQIISTNINSMDSEINQINILLTQLDNFDSELQKTKNFLDRLDRDLQTSIDKTRASKIKVRGFISMLDEGDKELDIFSTQVGENSGASVDFKNLYNLSENPIFLVFPLIISVIITFTSIVLSNLFILNQINKPSYFRDLITPTNNISFLVANYLINLLFIMVQIGAFFLVGMFWFKVPIPQEAYLSLVIVMFLAASVFIFLGMSIAYIVRSQSLSMLISIFGVILFLICSDLFIPTAITSEIIQFFISLNPFFMINKILTDLMLLGRGLGEVLPTLKVFLVYFVAMIVFSYLARKVNEEFAVE